MMLQPESAATPEIVVRGLVVQARVAPAGVVMLRVMAAVLVEMVLPPASWIATTGWAGKGIPPVELEGLVVKPSFVAVPSETVKFRLAVV